MYAAERRIRKSLKEKYVRIEDALNVRGIPEKMSDVMAVNILKI